MVKGLSHITLIVRDIQRTGDMLRDILDAKELYDSGKDYHSLSKEKFFNIGDIWLCIMENADARLPSTYNHVAFQIDRKNLQQYLEKIRAWNLSLRPDRKRIAGEAESVYFYDFDNHLFELHTGNLQDRLVAYHEIAHSKRSG